MTSLKKIYEFTMTKWQILSLMTHDLLSTHQRAMATVSRAILRSPRTGLNEHDNII